MRFLYGVLLLLAVAAVAVFTMQNLDGVTVNYMNWSAILSLPLMIAVAYVLGMVTGGAVVASLRHTLHRATEAPPQPRA
jgi:uncharacterized integral membrane protein